MPMPVQSAMASQAVMKGMAVATQVKHPLNPYLQVGKMVWLKGCIRPGYGAAIRDDESPTDDADGTGL
jgi:hypothetical protein